MGVRGFKMFYQRGQIFFSTCFVCVCVCVRGGGAGGSGSVPLFP